VKQKMYQGDKEMVER